MSGISFNDLAVKYDGTEYKVEITGTLPSGVTISYTNNKGTNANVYNAVATFTYDEANYNVIEEMTAVLTINKDKDSYVNPETNKEEVIVSSEEGIDPDKALFVELIEMEESTKDFEEFLSGTQRVAVAYDIKLLLNGESVQPDSTLHFKILIPQELRGKDFEIMHIHNNSDKDMIEYTIEGDYVVFKTDRLSAFVFVYDMGSLLWVVIVLAVLAVLEIAFLVFLIYKKNQIKKVVMNAVYPPFILGMFVPEWHIVLIILLAVIVTALAVVDILYAMSVFGKIKFPTKEKAEVKEETIEEVKEVVETPAEEVVNPEESNNEDADEDTMKVWDEETHSYTVVRIIKSFSARLSQSNDEVKKYYDIIRNELLSYKKVKSRISFKYETFKLGSNVIARMKFRGKTLCLYLALNPADYENTKYKVEDMSGVSSSVGVPTMYRIILPRRCAYAKELIYDNMKNLDTEKMNYNFIEYSKDYPYVDNEALLAKGLIKKLVKVVGEGESTKTIVNPVNIVKKVNVSEVNALISNEQVNELVKQSSRIADKTKKTIINIEVLSKYFNANEVITLDEIKKRVPGFNRKATYYKVLASGTIDKPLTVDADDFSIEAEKMIIVTGGKVLVSRTK